MSRFVYSQTRIEFPARRTSISAHDERILKRCSHPRPMATPSRQLCDWDRSIDFGSLNKVKQLLDEERSRFPAVAASIVKVLS